MPEIKAVFFDQDGVIIDTERDGHRVAFNHTFREFGYDFEWDVDEYHVLLQVAGGKERMRHYLHTKGFGVDVPAKEEDSLIREMHKRKTAIFVDLIDSGAMPLRPGILRFMKEVVAAGLKIAITTTTNIRSAEAVTTGMLSEINFDFVLAGDMVSKKKPDPEIYNMALQRTGFEPAECIVIEDSRNGVQAAAAAGMNIIATTNGYTEKEDLSDAHIIISTLGDPDGEKGKLAKGGEGIDYNGVLTVAQAVKYFS